MRSVVAKTRAVSVTITELSYNSKRTVRENRDVGSDQDGTISSGKSELNAIEPVTRQACAHGDDRQ